MSQDKTKVEINVVQVVASALAAVSSAVLLSTVGVAGTLIGAAAGSVIATVGAAIYSYSIRVSRERVAAAQAAALARMHRLRNGQTETVEEVAEPESHEPPAWREALSRVKWKWVAIVAAAVFVVAMLVITGFELLSGESVSKLTGGTSGTGHRTSLGFGSSSRATKSPSPTPSPSSTPSTSTSGTASTSPAASPSAPVTSTTPTPTPTPSQSDSAGSSPSSAPTETPSGTPSPSIVP